MWRTSCGERVLQGAEWQLFRLGLSCLWDCIEGSFDDPTLCETGISSFDDLQPSQKLALLALVGQAMHDAATPSPDLTAHTEGTAAAVFQHIRDSIEEMIQFQDEPEMAEHALCWRALVRAAAREVEIGWEELWPDPRCDDLEEWDCLLECLSSRILWDADYEMGRYFLDSEPDATRVRMQEMGIHPEYFLSVAPDPRDGELEQIRATLRQLTGRPEDEKLLLGFEDSYHGLLVGPCDEATLTAETGCQFIDEIQMCGENGFACSYEEWVKLFRDETKLASTQVPDPVVLTPEQHAKAEAADITGEPIILGGGDRIKRRKGGWVVIDNCGGCLIDVAKSSWSDDENDLEMPALRFGTAREALAAWVRAESIAATRAARYQAAMKRLDVGAEA